MRPELTNVKGALKIAENEKVEWSEDFYYNRNMWHFFFFFFLNVTVCIALAPWKTQELHHSHTLHETMETTSLSKDYKNPSSSTCEAHFWVMFVKSEC